MKSQPQFAQPPRAATWLVNLFIPGEDGESVAGDLHEEFSQLALKSGVAVARRWYWEQSLRTVAHLFANGFLRAPWSTAVTVIAGFFLLRFVHSVPDKLLGVVTDKYLMYWSTHFQAYLWVLKGLRIEYLFGSLLTGCVVGFVAKGREMVATMTLSLVLCAMILASFAWIVATSGSLSFLWNLPEPFADPFTIVIGGLIVRTRRSAKGTLCTPA